MRHLQTNLMDIELYKHRIQDVWRPFHGMMSHSLQGCYIVHCLDITSVFRAKFYVLFYN